MLILDTDHLSELDRGTELTEALRRRLASTQLPVATTVVSIEEQLRGRLSSLAKARDASKLVDLYSRLQTTIVDLSHWWILPWTDASAEVFDKLRVVRLGIGTMDLRIASIAIANNAQLLSRNLRDFERVPDLKVEDWLS